jgi:hypothetical protein
LVANTITPAGMPAGTLTFLDGTVALGQAALNGNGVATYNSSSLAAGTHSITAAYSGTANTLPSVSPAIQEVIVPMVGDFTLQVSPGSASVYTGAKASFWVSISATNGFDQNLALTCSGLPAATTCAFQPSSVAGGNGRAALTLQTSPPHPIAAAESSPGLPWRPAAAAGVLASLALFVLPRRMRLTKVFLMMVLGMLLASTMGACGGPGPVTGGTPPGIYNVSVTGTASPLSHSATVKLTVKSFF